MDILFDKIVKTRKEHTCWGCGEKFGKGVGLRHVKNVDAGTITASYWCRVCDATAEQHHDDYDDGYDFAIVKEFDGWEENKQRLERTYSE